MRERPILFSAPMVLALLEGRKTQTRRVVKPQTTAWTWVTAEGMERTRARCPYGQPGDALWVKETFLPWINRDNTLSHVAAFRADGYELEAGERWRPSIHMPRRFSRLTLRITDVRVERLNEISEADADAECFGGDFPENVLPELFPRRDGGWGHLSLPECYARLWEHINGPGSWAANPWVWVVTFERVQP